ncbi:MAG: dTDP-4-dehydrorhamnose 3,5-epimerase, partial [Alphaproteobacteria bacterium]
DAEETQRTRRQDDRGYLSRFYCNEEMTEAGFTAPIVQINHTLTTQAGAVRGMHFQHPPHAEAKFVSVLRGKIFDVAVDLRRDSPTYLHWHGEVLSADNARSLYIPEGFAHGFQTLVEDCELIYLHTSAYAPHAEGGVNAGDPRLAIDWPLPITDMSPRDRGHPMIDEDFTGLAL